MNFTRKLFVLLLFFAVSSFNAQSDLYNKLNSFIANQTKEVLENRLIAVNVWSVNDKESRDLNKEFEEAYKTFEYAKLKGGHKGIVVLNVNLDSDHVNADITLQKDGITKLIKVSATNTEIINAMKGKNAGYNIVFDNKGNLVYENLQQGTVFTNIQKLITR